MHPSPHLRKTLTKALLALLAIYALVVVVFALLQRSLLYFPSRDAEESELARAGRAGLEPIRSRAGDVLGYLAPHPEGAEATLVVAHGNAGSALDRERYVALAHAQRMRFDVLLIEYPGYGSRRGAPSEDANVAALEEGLEHAKQAGHPVVLMGESLGSAVVSLVAARRRDDVDALVLLTPLPRLELVVAHHYPFIPTFLLADRYEADSAIARFGGPVAFVVAGHDTLIPTPLGVGMHDGYAGPKLLEIDAQATHNTLDFDGASPLWQRVFALVREAIEGRPASP